jgi:hypothetical protein
MYAYLKIKLIQNKQNSDLKNLFINIKICTLYANIK